MTETILNQTQPDYTPPTGETATKVVFWFLTVLIGMGMLGGLLS